MKLSHATDDDRAVSPVIGVILMVAITVILAAVIGAFVLNLGDSMGQTAPNTQLSVEASDNAGNITVGHSGGPALDTSDLTVLVNGSATDYNWTDGEIAAGENADYGGGSIDQAAGVEIAIRHDPSESILLEAVVDLST